MGNSDQHTRLELGEGNCISDSTYASYADGLMKPSADNFRDKAKKQSAGKSRDGAKRPFPNLSTSKLRSIYSQIMNVYTRIDSEEVFESCAGDLQYLQVKMAYEAGRERAVKEFLKETGLMNAIKNIKDYEQFKLYCRYAESLVAYFKFYGGKDK